MRDWPELPALPGSGIPIQAANGRPDTNWYRYLVALDLIVRRLPILGLADLADVDLSVAPADTEVLTYVDVDGTWQAD